MLPFRLILMYMICSLFPACSSVVKVEINTDACDHKDAFSRLYVFVAEGSSISHVIYHSDTLVNADEPSLDLDFDFAVNANDSIQLFMGDKKIVLKDFNMNFPSLGISTHGTENVQLHYYCNSVIFD
jgi:hypothetical protein